MARQTLVLTPGDPTGIGPEITARFLAGVLPAGTGFRIIGDMAALAAAADKLGLALPTHEGIIYQSIKEGQPGLVCYQALEEAVQLIAGGEAQALVTGPISKQNLAAAGILESGHTEILGFLSRQYFPDQPSRAEMLFVHQRFRLLLLTRHIPLSQVTKALSAESVTETVSVLVRFLQQQLGSACPHLALLAVNPHAGEIGGEEEAQILRPAMASLMNAFPNIQLSGPFAADAFFREAGNLPYDAVIAAYHDQGLIPFKLMAGYEAVNVTIGLPFLRTSVSHGTAFDIAGQGIAKENSLIAAVNLAADWSRFRATALKG